MPKYKKNTIQKMLKEQVDKIDLNDITRKRLAIASLILENKSFRDIKIVYGYDFERDLK